jgi:hypothetical protein
MIYFVGPFLIFLTVWLALSLRSGNVNVHASRGNDWFSEPDSAQFSRHYAPTQYWIAIGALAALWIVCAVVIIVAICMGVAW